MQKKLKLIRVVTSSECVSWHLHNTLKRVTEDYCTCVVGKNVSIHKEKYPNVLWVDINIERNINPVSDLIAIFKLCKLFLSFRPDIVHSIMPKAGLLTSISGFACGVHIRIHTFTGQVWANKSGFYRFFFKLIDKLIINLNTCCLTDSPSQSSFLFNEGISFNKKPLPVLLCGSLSGVDTSRFAMKKVELEVKNLRAQFCIKENDFIFSFIARKSIEKGVINAVKAFCEVIKRHKNTKIFLVGPDESNGELEKILHNNLSIKENIINIDKVDNHEVYLALTHVLCLPSYREGFGSIVIDAAAMGVPTIGTYIPGLMDSIISDHTGILVKVGSAEELEIAMNKLIENPKIRTEMGINAKLRIDKFFTADLLYQALDDFYMSLINKKINQEIKH